MYRLKTDHVDEFEIKKSRFICYLHKTFDEEDAKAFIQTIKKEHPNARHHCYAFIIGEHNEIQRSNDDGEPAGTAGVPMLECLMNHHMQDIVAVTVRYFGGIKLGIGPLTRTYSKMAGEVIKKACKVSLVKGYNVNVSFSYKEIKKVDFILKDSKVIDKVFDNNVSYNAFVTKETLEKLSKYDISINKEVYIEKE